MICKSIDILINKPSITVHGKVQMSQVDNLPLMMRLSSSFKIIPFPLLVVLVDFDKTNYNGRFYTQILRRHRGWSGLETCSDLDIG